MFFAIIFIAIGVALLLNAMGLLSGGFWGVFWAVVFIAVGVRMLRKDTCLTCGWDVWQGKIRDKMNGTSCGPCCEEDHGAEAKPRRKNSVEK